MTSTKYSKSKRRIVIAFDVGTTFSGASYCIVEPGEVPTIQGVNKFPGQEHAGGDAKIPSVILYDNRGEVVAVGSEAVNHTKIEGDDWDTRSQEEYSEITWFKLHFRPKHLSLPREISALPTDKSAVDVFADFLRYLYQCVLDYISRKHFNGNEIVDALKEGMQFILTHPNGWGGSQQKRLRKAAIAAGLIKDMEDGNTRLCLLTEGEAAVHYCIRNALSVRLLANNVNMEGIVVIDAGGGTIDISAYTRDPNENGPLLKLKEIVTAQCIFHGSIFVTENARSWLVARLANSPCRNDIDLIVEQFDQTAKCKFRTRDEAQYIRYGTRRDNDPDVDIRNGQIKISGEDMARFFQPSVDGIVKAVAEVQEEARGNGIRIKQAFLVGGFATSYWLADQVKRELNQSGIEMQSPDHHLNKAVADGAISYYLDHFVTTRVSKYTYGIKCYHPYDPNNPEHRKRRDQAFVDDDGERYLSGIFEPILTKGNQVRELTEYRSNFLRRAPTKDKVKQTMHEAILRYEGSKSHCIWIDEEPEMYPIMCTVKSDISKLLRYGGQTKTGKKGSYYEYTYDVILSLGLTELKAEVEYRYNANRQKKTVRRSSAELIYDEDSDDEDSDEEDELYSDSGS